MHEPYPIDLPALRSARRAQKRRMLMYEITPMRHGAAKTLSRLVAESKADGGVVSWAKSGAEDPILFPQVWLSDTAPVDVDAWAGEDSTGRRWGVTLDAADEPPDSGLCQLLMGWVDGTAGTPGRIPDIWDGPVEDAAIWFLYDFVTRGCTFQQGYHDLCAHGLRQLAARGDGFERELDAAAAALTRRDLGETSNRTTFLAKAVEESRAFSRAGELYVLAYELAIPVGSGALGCQAGLGAGRAFRRAGRWELAERWYQQTIKLADFDDDFRSAAQGAVGLTHGYMDRGATPKAREWMLQALGLAGVSKDPWTLGEAHMAASFVHYTDGDLAAAATSAWRAAQTHVDPEWRGRSMISLGMALMKAGNIAGARDAYHLAVGWVGDASTKVVCMESIAYCHAVQGHTASYDEAWCAVEGALEVTTARDRSVILHFRAKALARLGRHDEARVAHAQAIDFARKHGFLRYSELSELELETYPDPPVRTDDTERIEAWLLEEVGV